MKKNLQLILSLMLGTSILPSCSNMGALTSAIGGSYLQTSANDKSKFQQGSSQFMKNGRGSEMRGPQQGGFGFPVDLKLTADQIKQLQTIRDENKPPVPDKTKMDEMRKIIDDAFIADTFDANALKAKVAALRPSLDAMFTSQATLLVKSYNVLTAEQKQTLETKAKDMQNKGPFGKLATDLGLTDAQKESLKSAMQPPNVNNNTDFQKQFEKMKSTQDAINTELKTGNPSIDKVKEILKNAAPDKPNFEDQEIDRLAKIHDILNADQRKKFIDNQKNMGFKKPAGPNPMMGKPGMGPMGMPGDGHGFPRK